MFCEALCDDCSSKKGGRTTVNMIVTGQVLCDICFHNHFAPLNEIPGTSDERIRNLLEEWPPPVPRAGSIWSRSHHISSTVRFVEECQAIIALGNGEQALRDLGQQWSSKTNQRIDEHVACHRFLEYRKEVDEELMKTLESQYVSSKNELFHADHV
ncbi:hypothetical protein FA13DRAFT_1781090 [Coprinellus micaceus]|uniref:Uncharacterized protein n=1 Tax=Coprinellus micaceus TaxID=71717 RepID=A0A4Y7SBA9_COPMI|nr:hypothetical protein FA13DRAFT_1781090 [Coprinellus micaceus]